MLRFVNQLCHPMATQHIKKALMNPLVRGLMTSLALYPKQYLESLGLYETGWDATDILFANTPK